ncbi:unnamed protein product [Didymodactylos carnosus]|uniref:Caspase family p20 domain-containing protein n=1 Tax=Didymodactylos carnosus TaxID=1234261 RepID=A0A814YM88_9BILA|nr:unnamed protein product [Didymodactylos carnosus]CAF3995455.1 unnamed protein product [Didymodactylos carnosus]
MCATKYNSQPQQRKIALIIGISDYENKPYLKNSINDANSMNQALQSIGFKTMLGCNLKYGEMEKIIQKFLSIIEFSDVVLFYFSGHGFHYKNVNYLIPLDSLNTFESNIKYHAISTEFILKSIEQKTCYVFICLLDCQGLKQICAPPMDCLIAIAYAPDENDSYRDRDSLFTKHLLQNITQSDKDIEKILQDVVKGVEIESDGQQILYRNGTLRHKDIYLNIH